MENVFSRVYKSIHGWKGTASIKTDVETSEGVRTLTLTTMKRHSGDIVTTANIGYTKDNFITTAVFSDYHKTLITTKGSATQKRVTDQHNEALKLIDELLTEVEHFYGDAVAA